MTVDEAISKYGPIVDGEWPDAPKWCTLMDVPLDISTLWINTAVNKPVTKIYCNKDLATPLRAVLMNIRDRGLISELKTFDGCFNVRDIRGQPGRPSAHCYALAIDINVKTNQLGTFGDISMALAQCFKDEGLFHGRNFKRMDPQHFSLLQW